MNPNSKKTLTKFLILSAVAAVPFAAGCDDEANATAAPPSGAAQHDDHAGHSDAESSPDEHAGYDDAEAGHDDHAGHGDEAGGEEHADEVRVTSEAMERFGIKVASVEARAPVGRGDCPGPRRLQHRGDGPRRLARERPRRRDQGAPRRHREQG